MPATPAQRKAADKYIKEKTDDIKVRVPKGDRDRIKEAADRVGMSVNAFINSAIQEKIEKSTDK